MKVTRGFATGLVLVVVVVSWGFGGLPRAGASDNREPAGSSTGTTELVDESGANPVGELIEVSEVIVHPWWAQNYFDAEAANVHPAQVSVADYRYDIALLRLATPASSTPVMLGTEAYAPPGATGTITGWGQDENGEYPIHLKVAAVPIHTDGECVGAGVPYWHGGNICIGTGDTAVTPHAACYGDSGGPLLVLLGHAWLQVGVASFGVLPCANYSAYWSISRVWPWIFCNTGVAPLGHGALPLCPSTRLPTHSVYAPLDPSRP